MQRSKLSKTELFEKVSIPRALAAMGIPTIGFGPGEYKLAHMRNERCAVAKIKEACDVYRALISEL